MEWKLNEMIAKEMKNCWDITGQGKADLFDQWWNLLECRKEGNGERVPCTEDNFKGLTTKNIIEEWWDKDVYWPPNWDVTKPPTFCVLCSRIKFDETAQKNLPPKVDKMGAWLASNPIAKTGPGSKIPYAVYLQNDDFEGIWASEHSYSYSTTEPLAVLYARVNIFKLREWAEIANVVVFGEEEDNIPESVQVLKLIPYQEIPTECTYLVG